jgi:hypothetical protein
VATRAARYFQPLLSVEHLPRRRAWFLGTRRALPPWAGRTGSQWMALSRRGVQCVLDADPALAEFYRDTLIPDQTYLQTVLGRSSLPLALRAVTYVGRGPGYVLRKDEVGEVLAGGAAFARKVDPSADPEVVRLLDEHVDRLVADAAGSPPA